MKFINYLKQRPILAHLLGAVVSIFIFIWIVLGIISIYTDHNNVIIVPDLSKISVHDLEKTLEDKNIKLKYQVIDSVYRPDFPKGSVYEQDPIAGTKVKKNRIIYITITASSAEKIKMPNLLDLSLKQATTTLETMGLKLGRLEYVPDIAENAVLHQKYKGREIKPETEIERGSTINLVLGKGVGSEKVEIPSLIGKTHEEVLSILSEHSLNIGSETFEKGTDKKNGVVTKQRPSSSEEKVSMGSSIDLWYSNKK